MKKIIYIFIILFGITCLFSQNIYGQNTKSTQSTVTDNKKNSTKEKVQTPPAPKEPTAKKSTDKNSVPPEKKDKRDKKGAKKVNDGSNYDEGGPTPDYNNEKNVNNDNNNEEIRDSGNKSMDMNSSTTHDSTTEENSDDTIIYLVIGVAFFIIVLFFIGISYVRSKDAQKTSDKNKKRIMDLETWRNQNNVNIKKINDQITFLQKRLNDYALQQHQTLQSNNGIGINIGGLPDNSQQPYNGQPTIRIYYLGAPNNAGFFSSASEQRSYNSVFKLTTKDGKSGTFIFIDDRNSINTATLAVEAIKIACKINNIGIQPSKVITVIEGCAEIINGQWKITSKGTITFVS